MPETNSIGCYAVFLRPPYSGVQALDDQRDCVITIKYSLVPEAIGKQVPEEYYYIKLAAGETLSVTAQSTGGSPDFGPFPTLFLPGGGVVQLSDAGLGATAARSIQHTAAQEGWFLLGVSSISSG